MNISAADQDTRLLTQAEVIELLQTPELLRLGFVDSAGWPVVHPVWFLFEGDRLWTTIGTDSLKARRLREDGRAYFTIDSQAEGNIRGVRGRARATVREDRERTIELQRALLQKYLGSEEGPIAEALMRDAQDGSSAVLELEPVKYLAWGY